MDFTLVIPAYNEEEAIASTLRRALAARATVLEKTPISQMTIVVVNDGSRDGTQEIIDRPEFYYNRFIIRDSSGHTVREVSLSTGYWSYFTAAIGISFLLAAIGSFILSRRCKH